MASSICESKPEQESQRTDPLRQLAQLPGETELFRVEHQLTRADLVRYAGASGDLNPIHYDDGFARAVGLPGVIAHGMLTMGLAVAPLSAWLGAAAGRIRSYQARFTRPVPVPTLAEDTLSNSGTTLLLVAKLLSRREKKADNQLEDRAAVEAVVELAVLLEGRGVLGKARVIIAL